MRVYICQCHFLSSSHPPFPLLCPHVLYICVLILALEIGSFVHFFRFHIYVLIHNICFSLSDLLHNVQQSLDPFTFLQMTQFHSFLWLINIPSCIYHPFFDLTFPEKQKYIHTHRWFYLELFLVLRAFLNYFKTVLSQLSSVVSNSLWPHGLQLTSLPCPSPTPGVYSDSCPLSRWCHPAISSSVVPSPPTFNLSQHQGLFKWVMSPKYPLYM